MLGVVNFKVIRVLRVLIMCFFPLVAFSQKTINKNADQLVRIAEFGKLWGVVNYFHPQMGKGNIDSDSLFLKYITPLINDTAAVTLKSSITGMLAGLRDTKTNIFLSPIADHKKASLARKAYLRSVLPEGQLYIALPQNVFTKDVSIDTIISDKEEDLIIDLRCDKTNNALGLKQYTAFIQPLIAGLIKTTMMLPTERSVYYKGLMRQDFPYSLNLFDPGIDGNVPHYQVNNGFRNISEGSYLLVAPQKKYLRHRYCFIINQNVNINTVKALMALRNRDLCYLIFDGNMPGYLFGTFYNTEVSGGYTAQIRCSEIIYEDGTTGPEPDLTIMNSADTTLHAAMIDSAVALLKSPIKTNSDKQIENNVYIRKPSNVYSTGATPAADLRLLGLFNFWNTIHFFSPNKNLITVDWEEALPYFIDKFLQANTEEKYFYALMELTAAINDGHAIMYSTKTGRSPRNIMDGNLPFACDLINNKVYVTSIMPDTAQQKALSALQYGDEVIAIDHIPVDINIKNWKPLLVASNNSGFNRELYATWFTAGSIGSEAVVSVKRNNQQKNIYLKRIGRNDYYNLWGKVARKSKSVITSPPYFKVLDGNIGYLRVNRVYSDQLDSIAYSLRNCKKIIIDARGYPKDLQIGTHLASYIAQKMDTVAYDLFPFITSPDPFKNQTLIEYAVIKPNSNQYLKNKKYVILADEGNQSQGEWNVIALQGVTNATTIGRTTAGANGMAVTINFPGDYISFFSGFAEYYPDHTPNQKLGVKIDVVVNKTLKAAIDGEDEILNKALMLAK